MKGFQVLFVFMLLAAASCSTSYKASNPNSYDDVYYSSSSQQNKNAKAAQAAPQPVNNSATNAVQRESGTENQDSRFEYANPELSSTVQKQDEKGNTYITNNYYNGDEYYDYAYSARLRRFYRPVGWGYFDSYYTNSYMYDYNPSSWGISIYAGYNWWAPASFYYSPFTWGFNISYGYPSYWSGWCPPYWYSGWYAPYYYPYGGYYMGYNQGYWNGYWHGYNHGLYGYNPYYYNSYDYNSVNSYYYGPRKTTGKNSQGNPRTSIAQLYQKSSPEGPGRTPVISTVNNDYNSVPRPVAPSSGVKDNTVRPKDDISTSPPRPKQQVNDENSNVVKPTRPVKNNDSYYQNPPPRPINNNPDIRNDNEDPFIRPGKNETETKPGNAPPRPIYENPSPRPVKPGKNVVNPKSEENNYSTPPKTESPAPRPVRPVFQAPKNETHSAPAQQSNPSQELKENKQSPRRR